MQAYYFGRQVVVMHDQDGLNFELSLEMFNDDKHDVALLGILCEATSRRMSRKLIREMALYWAKLWTPSPGEEKALEIIRSWD